MPAVEDWTPTDQTLKATIGEVWSYKLPELGGESEQRYEEVDISAVIDFITYDEQTQMLSMTPERTSDALNGNTYEIRVRIVDESGNSDSFKISLTMSLSAPEEE